MTKGEIAKNNFCNGQNCAQAVLTAFCKETGLDKDTAMKCASALGGGVGGMREICGAVNAMGIVLGLLYGSDGVTETAKKRELYARMQFMADKFAQKNGSIICRTLRGLDKNERPQAEHRTEKYYKIRPCASLCADAGDILEEYIKEHPGNC